MEKQSVEASGPTLIFPAITAAYRKVDRNKGGNGQSSPPQRVDLFGGAPRSDLHSAETTTRRACPTQMRSIMSIH